jgi:polyisoprenoid-binding protein YceI
MRGPKTSHWGAAFTVVSLALAWSTPVGGQSGSWTVDPKASLAWWQIVPHMHHLFGTTCPEDPAWIPGWGRDGNSPWHVDATVLKVPAVWDTVKMPLFPRGRVRPLCSEAITGEFEVPDTVTWRGIRGTMAIQANYVASGQGLRDRFMQRLLLESSTYPEIRFTLDSVVGVTRSAKGDTLRGQAVGKLAVHGAEKQLTGSFRAWPEAGGLRVMTRFHFPAGSLTEEFGMSKGALALALSGIWRDVWEGADLVLRPVGR